MARRLPKYVRVVKLDHYQHGGEKAKDLPWMKLYANTLTDLDLMALKPASFKVWICTLLLARRGNNRVPTASQTGTKIMQLTGAQVEEGMRDLLRIGLVEPFRVEKDSRKTLDGVSPYKRREEEKTKGLTEARPEENGLGKFKIPNTAKRSAA